MSGKHNAKLLLSYLEKEEVTLRRLKDTIEHQLMSLQFNEMHLCVAYEKALRNKKKNVTKKGKKARKEPKIKTEAVTPQKMTNCNGETQDLKPLHLGPLSKRNGNAEELQLEPSPMDACSDSDADAVPDLLLEPLLHNSEGNSLKNSK